MPFSSSPGSVTPRDYSLPPEIQQQLDAANRRRQMAALMVQGGQKGVPAGQMVGSHYVASSPLQGLNAALQTYLGAKGMSDADSKYQSTMREFNTADRAQADELMQAFLSPQEGQDVGGLIAQHSTSKYPMTREVANNLWKRHSESFRSAAPNMSPEASAMIHSRAGLPLPSRGVVNAPPSPIINQGHQGNIGGGAMPPGGGAVPLPVPNPEVQLQKTPEEIDHFNHWSIGELEKEIARQQGHPENTKVLKETLAQQLRHQKNGTTGETGFTDHLQPGQVGVLNNGQKIYGPGDNLPGPKVVTVNGLPVNKSSDPYVFSPDGRAKVTMYTDSKGERKLMPGQDEALKSQNFGPQVITTLVESEAKKLGDLHESVQTSVNKLPAMMNAVELINAQNYTSGSLADWRNAAAHAIQTLTGRVVDQKVATTEQLQGDLFEAFTTNLKQLGTTQLSNVDVQAAMGASPTITKDPRAAQSLMLRGVMGVAQSIAGFENRRKGWLNLAKKIPGGPDLSDQYTVAHTYELPKGWKGTKKEEAWKRALEGKGYDASLFNADQFPIVKQPGMEESPTSGTVVDSAGRPVKPRRRIYHQSKGFFDQAEKDLGGQ